MEAKEIKINVPEGYEIDTEKSTFEKIKFKKKDGKNLLLKDICARLPYGVKATTTSNGWNGAYAITGCVDDRIYLDCPIYDEGDDEWLAEFVKPYLRSISSMTKEETKTYNSFFWNHYHDWDGHSTCTECVKFEELPDFLTFCYKHHLDVWGLIPKGLALEAPEGMYNEKEK